MAIVLVDSICESRLSTRVVQMQRRSKMLRLQWMVESTPKAGAIKRMDNERDSLGGFHLRIAAFDAGCANATVEQDALPTMDGGINPKGWCNQLSG